MKNISDDRLFTENVIIDLSRIGAPETKSLIMSLLVMKLQEYRMCEKAGANLPLRHLTVLEEAHNILKRTSTEQSSESANLLGKSVEIDDKRLRVSDLAYNIYVLTKFLETSKES